MKTITSYEYFVAFVFTDGRATGFHNFVMKTYYPMADLRAVRHFESELADMGYHHPKLMSFNLLSQKEENDQ